MWEDGVDKPREECGVFGIYAPLAQVAYLTYQGLLALQHRGQESAGIAVSDGYHVRSYKGFGLVSEIFSDKALDSLSGKMGIGHVRYSTTGSGIPANIQPLVLDHSLGTIALAHNGNLTNSVELCQELSKKGVKFNTTSDSEVILNLIGFYYTGDWEEAIRKATLKLKGAYALVILAGGKIWGIRDSFGIRPLCIGRLDTSYCLASESCALDSIRAEFIRDVDPGEMVIIDHKGLRSSRLFPRTGGASCVFEYIYFASPKSTLDKVNVWKSRQRMGIELAKEYTVEADVVIPVPESGKPAAFGYANFLGLPLVNGFVKKTFGLRSFIQPTQGMRESTLQLKLEVNASVVREKRIIMIDDSLVRGTTSSRLVKLLRDVGAKEVHLLIASPPVVYPCYYGIDTMEPQSLIASRLDLEGIKKFISVDSLYYLSEEGLLRALGKQTVCLACFNGMYPETLPHDKLSKYSLENLIALQQNL